MSIICEYCGQIMGEGDGCTATHYKFVPNSEFLRNQPDSDNLIRSMTLILPRTRVGAVNDMFTEEGYKEQGRDTCHDCGAKIGYPHHEGCDHERCPRCGGQFISCDCYEDYDITEYYSNSDLINEPQQDAIIVNCVPDEKLKHLMMSAMNLKFSSRRIK